ncbi:MAG: hypothetical protein JXJ17_04440, partial [Anaerolineae bacterium]|nr:hypothetical protein [Anaerolineae bacterium]
MDHDNRLELERQYYEDYRRLLQREAEGKLKPVTMKCRFCGEEYELAGSDNHMHNCPEQLEAQRLAEIRDRWVTEQEGSYKGPDRRERAREHIDSLGISVISPRVFPDGSTKNLPRFAQYCKVLLPTLEVYAGIVKVKVPAQSSVPVGHTRGAVYGASDRSLRRLGERVQKVR